MKKKGFVAFPVLILIITIGIIGYLSLKNNNFSDYLTNNILTTNTPKLAYNVQTGIADPNNNNPDFGIIYTINTNGSNKKQLINFNRNDLLTGGNIEYIPTTNEILINTSKALLAISLKNGAIKTLGEGNYFNWYKLSPDRQWVKFDKSRGYPNEPIPIQLNLNSLETLPIDICHDNTSPFVDKTSNSLITVNAKKTEVIVAGTVVLSSNINLCNMSNGKIKTYLYEKEGYLVPQFVANNYLYFTVDQCCASTSSLKTLQQIDLRNGKIDSPISIPELNKKLNDNVEITYLENSLNGNNFLYFVDNNKFIELYNHQLTEGADTLISKFSYSQDNSRIDIKSWSSDGNLVLFDRGNKSKQYLYNFTTKKLNEYNLPDEYYTVLE